jgi:DNA-binding protein YbaB
MLGDGRDLDAAERWVDSWETQVEERLRQARELSQRVAELTAIGRSADGLVEVRVGSSGTVTGLWLDEGIRRQPAARTAEQILVAMRRAMAELADRVGRVTEETVGAQSETGRAVMASFASRVPPANSGDDDGWR